LSVKLRYSHNAKTDGTSALGDVVTTSYAINGNGTIVWTLEVLSGKQSRPLATRVSSLRICLARCPGAETWILKQRPDLETTVIRAMGEPLDTKIGLFEDDDEVTSGMLYAPKPDRPQLTFLIDNSLASPVSSQGSSMAIQVWPLMPPHPTGLEMRMKFQLASTAYPRLSWMETSRQSRTRIAWVANVDDPDPSNSAILRRTCPLANARPTLLLTQAYVAPWIDSGQ
jgi:hypothetical protein